MLKLFIRYFFSGLLYTVPTAIVFYVVVKIFLFITDVLHRTGLKIHPWIDPFMGLALLVFLIIIVGILGNSLLIRPFFRIIEYVIDRTPFISVIYTSIKDLLKAFVGENKRFNQPVIVAMNQERTIEKIGFVTQNDLKKIGVEHGKVAVYCPHSYNFSGDLFIVAANAVKPLNMSSSEAMKFIVTGGIIDFEEKKN